MTKFVPPPGGLVPLTPEQAAGYDPRAEDIAYIGLAARWYPSIACTRKAVRR